MRDNSLTGDPPEAETLIGKAITARQADPELGIRTLGRWRTEILAHHLTGASNGPTEAPKLLITRVKRAGHGFRDFHSHRLRIVPHAGGVNGRTL